MKSVFLIRLSDVSSPFDFPPLAAIPAVSYFATDFVTGAVTLILASLVTALLICIAYV